MVGKEDININKDKVVNSLYLALHVKLLIGNTPEKRRHINVRFDLI